MKYCPKCKSADIHPYLPGFFNMYKCKKCEYVGSLVIEKLNNIAIGDEDKLNEFSTDKMVNKYLQIYKNT